MREEVKRGRSKDNEISKSMQKLKGGIRQ